MSQTRSTTILQPKQVFVGAKGAQVTLVEFGDYESTACAEANTVVKELLDHFDGDLKFVLGHLPLSQIHQKAMKAAEAAVAAAQTGKFWEMHNILLDNRKHLGLISLKEYAKEIGITDKRFLTNLISLQHSFVVVGSIGDYILDKLAQQTFGPEQKQTIGFIFGRIGLCYGRNVGETNNNC